MFVDTTVVNAVAETEVAMVAPQPPVVVPVVRVRHSVRIIDIVQAELDEGLEDEFMEDEILPQSETTIPETDEDGFPLC